METKLSINSIQTHKVVLLTLGSIITLVGIIMLLVPVILLRSAAVVFAIGLFITGSLKASQFIMGKNKKGYSMRAVFTIFLQIIIDFVFALLLLGNSTFSLNTLGIIFGLIFVIDGIMQCYICLGAPTTRSRVLFFISGLVTFLLAVLILLRPDQFRIDWVGILLGIRLISFGLVLITIVLRTKKSQDPIIYTEIDPEVIQKETGELYACYFGTAFHLGVYIGNNEVVHYRDDNIVHRTSWEEFLRGREPQHWEYPDIKGASPNAVVKTAMGKVGEVSKYSLLKNNCEHFAIYCKTGGATRYSKYAQIPAVIENVSSHPVAGLVVELYSRIVEWIGFHVGGTVGKKAGFRVREYASILTAWMLTSSQLKKKSKQD